MVIIKGVYSQGCLRILKSGTRARSSTQLYIYILTPTYAYSRRLLRTNHTANLNDEIVPHTQSNYCYMFSRSSIVVFINNQYCVVGYRTPKVVVNHEKDCRLNQKATPSAIIRLCFVHDQTTAVWAFWCCGVCG